MQFMAFFKYFQGRFGLGLDQTPLHHHHVHSVALDSLLLAYSTAFPKPSDMFTCMDKLCLRQACWRCPASFPQLRRLMAQNRAFNVCPSCSRSCIPLCTNPSMRTSNLHSAEGR